MPRQTDVYYRGRDDPLVWRLRSDGDELPAGFYLTISRVVLTIGETIIDTAQAPLAITWSNGNLHIELKHTDVQAGRHDPSLVVHTSDEPEGLRTWWDLPWVVVREDE